MRGGLYRIALVLAGVMSAALPGAARAGECRLVVYAELPVTMQGLRASVPVSINHHDTTFWLDSGAFFSIMPREKAAELELPVEPILGNLRIRGIGGDGDAEVTTIRSFGFAKADLRNEQFVVGGSDIGNALIGANILGMKDTEFDLAHGVVKITDVENCRKANLAYWAQSGQVFTVPLEPDTGPTPRFRLPVTINGVRVSAELDTGSPHSLLSRRAAEEAKIDLGAKSAVATHGVSGFGRRTIAGWSVPVADIGVGDEHVLNTRIDVIDGPVTGSGSGPDMLLGADFVLTHHIYVSRRTHTIFFTYSGGPPFRASAPAPADPAAAAKSDSAAALPTGMHAVVAVEGGAGEPATADDFARRASARLAERNYAGAVLDDTAAIHLAPNEAAYYRERAQAYGQGGQAALARADLDKAIVLDPQDGRLLIMRGMMRLREHDRAGALTDTEAAVKLSPPTSLETATLAGMLTNLGQPQRAAAMMSPVIAAHPDDSRLGGLLNGRCWSRALANVELDKALDDCNRAIRKFGPNPTVLDSRGLVHYRQGDLAGAIADYDTALKTNPKLVWSLFMRGAAKAKQGDAAGEKADQDAAKAINPKIAEDAARYGLP